MWMTMQISLVRRLWPLSVIQSLVIHNSHVHLLLIEVTNSLILPSCVLDWKPCRCYCKLTHWVVHRFTVYIIKHKTPSQENSLGLILLWLGGSLEYTVQIRGNCMYNHSLFWIPCWVVQVSLLPTARCSLVLLFRDVRWTEYQVVSTWPQIQTRLLNAWCVK